MSASVLAYDEIATAKILDFNNLDRIILRRVLIAARRYP